LKAYDSPDEVQACGTRFQPDTATPGSLIVVIVEWKATDAIQQLLDNAKGQNSLAAFHAPAGGRGKGVGDGKTADTISRFSENPEISSINQRITSGK
jgi:hypothetical protein